MTLDATLRPLAKRLHEDYGKSSTLTVVTEGTYSGGQYSGGSTATHTVFCTPPKRFRQDQIDGERVRQDDFTTTIPAKDLSVVPNNTDTLTFDGVVYSIVNVTPVYSGAEVAMYELHCRK